MVDVQKAFPHLGLMMMGSAIDAEFSYVQMTFNSCSTTERFTYKNNLRRKLVSAQLAVL